MKRHAFRRMRAALLSVNAWAIHEPALHALYELLGDRTASARSINERLGLGPDARVAAAEEQSTIQMVGDVAVLPVMGVIQQRSSWFSRYMGWTATEQLERDFKAAVANDQVKGIVLYCDSPGGVASGIDEVATTIYQARGTKPIRGFVRGYCCSAAYYLLSSCHKITASPSSTVGSIGCIYTHVEYADYLKEAGLGVTVIKHGERKGDGNPYERLKPEARAALQKWVSDYGLQFEKAVARGRDVTLGEVRGRFGQGGIFLAAESKDRGLIDQVGAWEDVLKSLRSPASPLPQPGHSNPLVHGSQELAAAAPLALPLPALAPASFGSSASALPAGASAGPSDMPPAAAAARETDMKISARVRAALFARGLIQSHEADEAVCLAALNAYFAARGEACPQEDDKILAGLMTVPAAAASGAQQPAGNPQQSPAANVQQAHDKEMAEARQQAAASERERIQEIRASGQLLNMTAEQVEAAIKEGKPHAEVVAAWHKQLAQQEKPIGQSTVNVGQDGSERFASDACLSLQVRLGHRLEGVQVSDQVRQMAGAPLSYFATECLRQRGIRVDAWMPAEQVFEEAFAMDGYGRATMGGAGPVNRPGSFPNLLSNLANKILDEGFSLAGTSYADWTGQWPSDLPDFKPAPVVSKGMADELDEILDAEASQEFGLQEEMLSYMQLARFSNKFGLTPVMAANDDLNAFAENLLGLAMAHENTVNRLCLRLLTGNVTLLDGVALFDNTSHGNDITTGGAAPSVTSWNTMELRVAAQRGIGTRGYVRAQLGIALIPPAHKLAALQTFMPLQTLGEMKQPTADTSINVYRGSVSVVTEPELAASSSDVWYGLVRPQGMFNASVIRAYFRGWGRNGRRQRWYDPDTKCWYTELEGRFGAAAKQYRTIVRNDGTA